MHFRNEAKRRLARGEVTVGTWVLYVQTPGIVRMIAEAGFHFCIMDFQHSSFSTETVAAMCDVGRACGVTPLVRPVHLTQGELNRLQDSGAAGFLFPDVRTRSQIDLYRSWLLYPPEGTRGIAVAASGSDYDPDRGATSMQRANDETLVAILVEHVEAVPRIDELLDGGGVDLVEIGRNDLAASLGHPGDLDHPEVIEAVRYVVRRCRARGISAGTGVDGAAAAERAIRDGMRCVCVGSDRRMLVNGYRSVVQDLAEILDA